MNWSTAASSTLFGAGALHARKTTALPLCWSPAHTFSLGAEAHEIEAPFHILSKHSLSPANHKRTWHSPRTIGSGVPYRPSPPTDENLGRNLSVRDWFDGLDEVTVSISGSTQHATPITPP